MKKITPIILIICATMQVMAQKLDLLQNVSKTVNLTSLCSKPYTPYPEYENRDYWQSLPDVVKKQAIADGEKALDYVWKSVTITSYLDFRRKGIRQPNDQHIAERHNMLSAAVLAELVEGKGRFMDAIANGVWSLCEQSSWVATAHISLQRSGAIPDVNKLAIDLSSGETANALSWTHYFFAKELSKMSSTITERLEEELKKHILDVYINRDDLWWMASKENAFVNNWNPWCNFNVLLTALLVEKDVKRKELILRKSLRSVDQFINYYGNDGGCEEGPTYWDHAGGKMMEYLALVNRFSGGSINIFSNDRIRNMGLYIAKAHIDSLYFINFADAEARAKPIPTTIYRYGKDINDEGLMQFGSYIGQLADFKVEPLGGSLDMRLWQTELYDEICATPAKAPLYREVWLENIELAVARIKEGTAQGFTFAAKGGFNEESHNHNDVGSFVLYMDGQPLIVDAGVGTYTAKTFSAKRYEMWTMQSEFHNLPIINGLGQKNGKEFHSVDVKYADNGRVMSFALDLAKSYPAEAGCKSWVRAYKFNRKAMQLTITDNYELNRVANAATELNFMIKGTIAQPKAGMLEVSNGGKNIKIEYDESKLEFSQQNVELDDPRLTKIWGESLTRVSLRVKNSTKSGRLRVTISY